MRKLISVIAATAFLAACNNQAKTAHLGKIDADSLFSSTTRVDSSYATYSLGNSIETFTTKVYIVFKDTFLLKQIDKVTARKVDTTVKTYFIPRLDTLFADQAKRQNPVVDSITKKTKQTIIWVPIDENLVLVDYKKK